MHNATSQLQLQTPRTAQPPSHLDLLGEIRHLCSLGTLRLREHRHDVCELLVDAGNGFRVLLPVLGELLSSELPQLVHISNQAGRRRLHPTRCLSCAAQHCALEALRANVPPLPSTVVRAHPEAHF